MLAFLVRHARAELGGGISEYGREMMKEVADEIAPRLLGGRITVWSSPLERAKQSGVALCEALRDKYGLDTPEIRTDCHYEEVLSELRFMDQQLKPHLAASQPDDNLIMIMHQPGIRHFLGLLSEEHPDNTNLKEARMCPPVDNGGMVIIDMTVPKVIFMSA